MRGSGDGRAAVYGNGGELGINPVRPSVKFISECHRDLAQQPYVNTEFF